MIKREPTNVLTLSIVTFGIYYIIWLFETSKELNKFGYAQIPNPWFVVIPFANIYWLWKYSEVVESITGGAKQVHIIFVLTFFAGPVGAYLLQKEYNALSLKPESSFSSEAPATEAVAPEVHPQSEAAPEDIV